MAAINRKQIEDYYEIEWKEIVSQKTINLLIELTCQSYKLNKPQTPNFLRQNEPKRPHNLGQV